MIASILRIPLSVTVIFFSYLFLYLGTVRSMDTWLAITAGALVPIFAAMIWFDLAVRKKDAPLRAEREAGDDNR